MGQEEREGHYWVYGCVTGQAALSQARKRKKMGGEGLSGVYKVHIERHSYVRNQRKSCVYVLSSIGGIMAFSKISLPVKFMPINACGF